MAKLTARNEAALDKDNRRTSPIRKSIWPSDRGEKNGGYLGGGCAARAADIRAEARRLADEIGELEAKGEHDRHLSRHRELQLLVGPLRGRADRRLPCRARVCCSKPAMRMTTANLFEARDVTKSRLANGAKVLDKFPCCADNNIMADELVDEIEKYKKVLGKIPARRFPKIRVARHDRSERGEATTPRDEAGARRSSRRNRTKADASKESEEPKKRPTPRNRSRRTELRRNRAVEACVASHFARRSLDSVDHDRLQLGHLLGSRIAGLPCPGRCLSGRRRASGRRAIADPS